MTQTIVVEPDRGDRLRVRIGRHELAADQPLADGGEDSGPTPTELFVAGYAACIVHYGSRYLRRHGLSTEGLHVRCTYLFADAPPPRVDSIDFEVSLPPGLEERDATAIRRVMERCTVGNTLKDPPRVRVSYREGVRDVLEHPALR
jgi:uncharacterized OsmC-like protein